MVLSDHQQIWGVLALIYDSLQGWIDPIFEKVTCPLLSIIAFSAQNLTCLLNIRRNDGFWSSVRAHLQAVYA
jgi:hypothetical protein